MNFTHIWMGGPCVALATLALSGCNPPASKNDSPVATENSTPAATTASAGGPGGAGRDAVVGGNLTDGAIAVALTTAECKQLGGTVEENRTCGGNNKQCRTNTVSSTGTVTSNTLCINEQ